MIDDYAFGTITIHGTEYTKDIRITPDNEVVSEWWRKDGHIADIDDVSSILTDTIDILVLGTGTPGRMKASPELKRYLQEKNIRLIEQNSHKAAQTVNELCSEGTPFAAGFHLTC